MGGSRKREELRLKRQIADLAPLSDAHLAEVGIKAGERVVDLGLAVQAARFTSLVNEFGLAGSVLGLERSPHFVELARHFAADLGLPQVEVRQGDAYNTGLPRRSFDGAHMRLVLVNVPKPELIVREMVALVRPGGWVASFEADLEAMVLDPPSAEFERLRRAYFENARSQGIDLFVGRRTHRLFRDAGVTDIAVDVAIQSHPPGHSRRPIFRDFINNVRTQLIGGGFLAAEDLERDLSAYERQLADENVVTTSSLFFCLRGRVPLSPN